MDTNVMNKKMLTKMRKKVERRSKLYVKNKHNRVLLVVIVVLIVFRLFEYCPQIL